MARSAWLERRWPIRRGAGLIRLGWLERRWPIRRGAGLTPSEPSSTLDALGRRCLELARCSVLGPLRRRLVVLLLVALAAAACGGGDEEANDTSATNDEAAPSGTSGGGGSSAQAWPHCVEYQRLLEAIARLDSADLPAAREGSEGAEFIADLELENATTDYEAASSAAVAAAEELAADEAVDSEARLAAETALAAFTAAADASRFVVYGDSAEPLDTPNYAEAFDLALEAVRRGSGDGQDIDARLATLREEIATLEAEINAELADAAGATLSERRQEALAEKRAALNQFWAAETELEAELAAAAAQRAAFQAELEAAQADLDRAQAELDAYREQLVSAMAELAAATADRSRLGAEVAALSSLRDEAHSAAAAADSQLERALVAARADVETTAEAARADAEVQASALEAVAAIARGFGDSGSTRDDAAYTAAYDPAYAEARRGLSRGDSSDTAWVIAREAAYASQAAMSQRLDDLAGRAGLDSNIVSAFESSLSAWIAAWPLAGDRGNVSERAAVMDRQPVYDDLAYRAAARLVRVAVAESVPVAQSVAAAETEDVYWVTGGAAYEAFVAARDRISAARVDYRGLVHPGTDGIAWNALHVALDILENRALAEAADARNQASQGVADPETDQRVVNARAGVEQTVAAVAQAESNLSSAEVAHSEASTEEASRENDVLWLQDNANATEAWRDSVADDVKDLEAELSRLELRVTVAGSPVSLERAQRAAWAAVASVTGCV